MMIRSMMTVVLLLLPAIANAQATTAKGYVVAEIKVTDGAAYEQYRTVVPPIVSQFGGRYLVRGGVADAIEGAAPEGRIVVIEFASVAAARAFYASPDYQAIASLRKKAAQSRVLIIEGVPTPAR